MKDDNKRRDEFECAADNLYDSIIKDEERFETKITYLGAGAIALSLTFATATNAIASRWMLYLGIAITGLSLIMNMYSCFLCRHREALLMILSFQ